MEPAFYRGDILFLNKGSAPLRTGEIVVFNIDGRDIPIVHRIIKFHERRPGGKIDILTKVLPEVRTFLEQKSIQVVLKRLFER